jgi:hypothetical protein
MGEKGNVQTFFVECSEVKKLLRRPKSRWEDNIKLYLRTTRWGGMDFVVLAEHRHQWLALINMVMNLGAS